MIVRINRKLAPVVVLAACVITYAQEPDSKKHPWRTADPLIEKNNRGVGLMEQYKYGEAAEAFQAAVDLAPESFDARLNLAIATMNRSGRGDAERAATIIDGLLKERPDDARTLYMRGIIHHYAGQDAEAVSYFERVAKQYPKDAYNWYLLARSKLNAHLPARAELKKAIENNPALVSAYHLFMRIALEEGNREEARKYQKIFLDLRSRPLKEEIVTPQYRKMGPLSLVYPLSPDSLRSVTSGKLTTGDLVTLFEDPTATSQPYSADRFSQAPTPAAHTMALADVNGDGRLDVAMIATAGGHDKSKLMLLLATQDGKLIDATSRSGLDHVQTARSCAFGDFDNDGKIDLFVACHGPNYLFRGRGDGTFEDVTQQTRTAGGNAISSSAIFLDADHDADLDIYVCNLCGTDGQPAANQLLNNNADMTFTDIAAEAGVDCTDFRSIMAGPADIDNDRDTDLVVFDQFQTAHIFINDRLGKYHTAPITAEPFGGHRGGVLQDFNADGRPDLLTHLDRLRWARLYLSRAGGTLELSAQFDDVVESVATYGEVKSMRVMDLDLDGDLDVALFGREGHALLNDGLGRFVLQPGLWPAEVLGDTDAIELADWNGDGLADVILVKNGEILMVPTQLDPPANWLAMTPTGERRADPYMRSPASGYGTQLTIQAGVHRQVLTYSGANGGLCQSHRPMIVGLDGAKQADYVAFRWPDGITQAEIGLPGGQHHTIHETDRKTSSCPVLFTWNGQRFGFITDFAGVGGMGYFVAPGEYAPPQVLEHVKIEPHQLKAKDGMYELRACEPMEEVVYMDRIELLAIDHPNNVSVFPDERLAVTGDVPTHQLICVKDRIFPTSAVGPEGEVDINTLRHVDRQYAYQPRIDRRFIGFCEPHTLTVDFSERLRDLPTDKPVWLFINGSIEYPYSQTTFAAGQARVEWQPIRIERQGKDGTWETIVPDAGTPGGIGRMITLNLTGQLTPTTRRLRVTTNLEIYFDQLFISVDHGTTKLIVHTVALDRAELRRLGFPLEYSPDGKKPTIFNYHAAEATSSFKLPRGRYTRYGRVDDLLASFDDRYAIFGTGDEIALSFEANALPALPAGHARSFVLISHAYCKDMDLYTAEPDTVGPLPFRGMSRYPYPADEHYPTGKTFEDYQDLFNTRLVN